MSANSNLSPAGGSTYSSNTMYVGDGTWDTERNTFLLPNLQGLNFATMRYNGMGNRFRDLPEYHVLITGHGVIAAITFMGIIPAAIFIARFYHSGGRMAYKLHVYLQIIVVFLATVVFILGFIAVGPRRALSNPHHGIGLAIYVCILAQFLYGWWWSRRERKRTKPHPTIPLKVHIHRLFGRAIALLGFIQIALGLTLYGSPQVLFILFTLWSALLLFSYLTLEYRSKPRIGSGAPPPRSDYYSDYSGSYLTGDQTELTHDGRRQYKRESNGWGKKVATGAGLFGAYKWYQHRREKKLDEKEDRHDERDRRYRPPPGTPGPASSLGPPPPHMQGGYGPSSAPPGLPPPVGHSDRRPSSRGSHAGRRHGGAVTSPQSWENDEYEDEKYGARPPRRSSGTWRNRILGVGAGVAAVQGVKSLFGGRRHRSEGYADSRVSYDGPSQTDVSRVEAGQAPFSPDDPRNNTGRRPQFPEAPPPMTPTRPPARRRPSADSFSYDDDDASLATPRPGASGGQTLRNSIAAMGAVAGFREWNKQRKDRRERERLSLIRRQEMDNEADFNRRNSNRYPKPQDGSGRRPSMSGTLMTGPTGPDPVFGSNPALSRNNFRPDTNMPPLPAAAGTIPSASVQPNPTIPQYPTNVNVTQHEEQHQLPYNLPPPPPGPPPNVAPPAGYGQPLQMPSGAVEPDPTRLTQEQSQHLSTNQVYQDGAAAAAIGAMGTVGSRTQSQSPSRRRDSRTRLLPGRRRSSSAAGSGSNLNTGGVGSAGSPTVSVKVNPHPDGRHVTLRRLNEQEAAAERSARRNDRRTRRASSLSSGGEDSGRYRRTGGIRSSSHQPITNVPPPPAMSSSAGGSHRRPSELNLPPAPAPAPVPMPQASISPQATASGLLPAVGPAGSGQVGSPGAGTDMGTGTDLSTFDNNRRRRRAERQRRLEAARGGGNRVEFE